MLRKKAKMLWSVPVFVALILMVGILAVACATAATPQAPTQPPSPTPAQEPSTTPTGATASSPSSPPARLEKLDALLTGVVVKLGDPQPQNGPGDGEFRTLPREFDSPPFHTDEAGNVFVDALIMTDGSVDGLEDLGITVQSQVGTVVSARIPLESLAPLTHLPNVEFVESARPVTPS
jgi:hypothetical protein